MNKFKKTFKLCYGKRNPEQLTITVSDTSNIDSHPIFMRVVEEYDVWVGNTAKATCLPETGAYDNQLIRTFNLGNTSKKLYISLKAE